MGGIDHRLSWPHQRLQGRQCQLSVTRRITFEVDPIGLGYGSANLIHHADGRVVVSLASETSWPAVTWARRRLPIVSPKLMSARSAGRDHVRCLCQKFVFVGRAITDLYIAVEWKQRGHQNACVVPSARAARRVTRPLRWPPGTFVSDTALGTEFSFTRPSRLPWMSSLGTDLRGDAGMWWRGSRPNARRVAFACRDPCAAGWTE
jgi:hypothetical protein